MAREISYHDKPGKALTPQTKINPSNFPFTLNPNIGCLFKCLYCYTQGFPFNNHAKFGEEVKVKIWLPEVLDKELDKYRSLPQHLKRVQVNSASEGYLPWVMAKTKRDGRDILMETLQVFQNHWNQGNRWMVHLLTKSHMILKHLDILMEMSDQVQVELTITTLDEEKKKLLEGYAPTVKKRLDVIERLANSGIFVRVMCMPFIGTFEEAAEVRNVVIDRGASGFKHKKLNYFDEQALLAGELIRVTGRNDTVFKDLLLNSSEPVIENGQPRVQNVLMPIIIQPGKSKRWQGYSENDFAEKDMVVERSGYSEINEIDWGYIV